MTFQKIDDMIESNGFGATLAAFDPSGYERFLNLVKEHGALKGTETFKSPDWYQTYTTVGPYYTGPLGDSTYIYTQFVLNGWSKNLEVVLYAYDYDPRECNIVGDCTCSGDWDDDDYATCDSCELGEDFCRAHDTHH